MWIEKLPNGKFKYIERYVDPYSNKTKKVSKILAKDTPQAQTQARKFLNEKISQNTKKKSECKLTVSELLEEWFDHYSPSIRPSTIRVYKTVFKLIHKEFKYLDALITNADTTIFQIFFDDLDRSYAYKKKIRSVLHLAFDYAVFMEYISSNPIDRVKLVKPAQTIEDSNSITNKFLEFDEAMRLINEIRNDKRSWQTADIYELLLLTGMRIGELLALRQYDYHKKSSTLDIHRNLDYINGIKNASIGPTKNSSSYRTIILSDRAKEIIEANITANKIKWDQKEDGYIFIGNRGTHRTPNNLVVTLKKANERLGDKKINKPLSNHIFRHSYISLLAELGVSPKAIMEQVGHINLKTTTEIYTHVTKKVNFDIAEKLNSLK